MSQLQKTFRTPHHPAPPRKQSMGPKKAQITSKKKMKNKENKNITKWKLSVNMSKPQNLIRAHPNPKNSQKVHKKFTITHKK